VAKVLRKVKTRTVISLSVEQPNTTKYNYYHMGVRVV
jgi:hypothetical protein